MKEKYINLFTDFGFKRIFGEETSKEHLISFLNTLLPERHQIEAVQFYNPEPQGNALIDRKAIFDLHCVSSSGEFFIVELQKAKQNFFKDRSVFHATFLIQQQAQRRDWNFRLSAVYTVGILDFIFDDAPPEKVRDVIHWVQLKNQHHEVFHDKLTFIYVTLPNFTKTLDQLETLQDKWLYLFRHLHELDDIPPRLRERVFLRLFEQASTARLGPDERQAYESSLKYYRALKNVIDTARGEGREEGRELGRREGRTEGEHQARVATARKLIELGSLSDTEIALATDLAIERIAFLRDRTD